MKKKSLLTMVVSMALVAVVGVGSTLAYFSDQTKDVKNTFTVGEAYDDVALKLEENPVARENGGAYVADPNEWVRENEYTEIMPGELLPKNPTVKLTADSVSSYVFVVVDGVDETLKALGGATLNGWVGDKAELLKDTDEAADALYDGVYCFETTKGTELFQAMFESIQVPADATFDAAIPAMNFRAGAIQKQTFATAEDAYNVFLETYAGFEDFQ